jgi:hypothetical protein
MVKLLRFFVRISLIPLIYALAYEAFLIVPSNVTVQSITWFLAGLGASLLMYLVLFGSQGKAVLFLETLKHELAHAAVSLMLFKIPETFTVDVSDEKKKEKGKTGPARGCIFGALAPYYLPVLTIPVLLIKPVTPASLRNITDLAIGLTLAFHYVTAIKDFHFKQTDITKTGRIFSTIVVILFNIIWLVIILCVVTNNYAGIVTYFKGSVIRAVDIYKALFQAWPTKVLPALGQLWEILKQLWELVVEVIF